MGCWIRFFFDFEVLQYFFKITFKNEYILIQELKNRNTLFNVYVT